MTKLQFLMWLCTKERIFKTASFDFHVFKLTVELEVVGLIEEGFNMELIVSKRNIADALTTTSKQF